MKIIFFDYWLKGVANFERLIPGFQKYPDIEMKMIHVGSWKERQQSIVTKHNGFTSYDISFYKTNNLYRILKREQADVVVMLNLCFFLDKAIVAYCKKLNMKVIYLAHGNLLNDVVLEEFHQNVNKSFKKNPFGKLRKDTVLQLWNYFYATCIINHSWGLFIKSLIRLLRNPATMTIYATDCRELDVDQLLVYYLSDKYSLMKRANFDKSKIVVTGNPDLDSFINKNPEPFSYLSKKYNIPLDYVLYLEDGFVQAKILSKEQWYSLLKDISDVCRKNNLVLVVKLHPRTRLEEHRDFFRKENIIPIVKEDMKTLVYYASSIVSQRSTTIVYGLILKKKVLSPRWGHSMSLSYNYPVDVIRYCHTIEEFENILISKTETCTNDEYMKNNIGLMDGRAVERIVASIKNIF